MNKEKFKASLDARDDLQKDLFIRGFLVTDNNSINTDLFPFYGNWDKASYGKYNFYTHTLTNKYFYTDSENRVFFLVGHAYNPFTMEINEVKILEKIASAYNSEQYFEEISDITGIFLLGVVENDIISYLVDPSGMQSACSGKVNNSFYLTSHAQLVGDICNLDMDAFVKKLVKYKWYKRVMGPYLPADLTAFSELKRVVPNTYYDYTNNITHNRFWPLVKQEIAYDEKSYNNAMHKVAEILKNNMILVSQKWQKPWISLTGGIDSNTTFASANGIYDKFEAFSYVSAEKEIRDKEAAEKIAKRFNVKFNLFNIPQNNEDVADFDNIIEILRHNNSYVAEPPQNEARKRIYLKQNIGCDVEVKSWVSETVRCYWYKHYGRTSFPKLSGKLYRNLYKIFMFNRPLAWKLDKVFAKFINEYEFNKIPECYPPADMHYNDVTWGSWGGSNISEMKYCFDITMIYNNRRFLDLMFQAPVEKRISDQHHLDVKRILNKELSDMNIRVVNMKETDTRAFLLNIIFIINRWLPF